MTARKVKTPEHELFSLVQAGDRRAVARAITLVESTRPKDREAAETLLGQLLPHAGKAIRVGISGAPGAGKSTFIEAFGKHLTGQGLKVAVLAIDPTSRRSGGSILGDKTRMEALARDPGAFIRPSPAGNALGGVARRTREAMIVLGGGRFRCRAGRGPSASASPKPRWRRWSMSSSSWSRPAAATTCKASSAA